MEQKKLIKMIIFSSYNESTRPWYVTNIPMTKKQYNKAIRDFRVKEFAKNDSWRAKTPKNYSWEEGYINSLHD